MKDSQKITKQIFDTLCNKYYIHPNIALESDLVYSVISNESTTREQKAEQLEEVFQNEF